jgi:hypothetical protein
MRFHKNPGNWVYFDEYGREIQQKGLIHASESDNVCAILT